MFFGLLVLFEKIGMFRKHGAAHLSEQMLLPLSRYGRETMLMAAGIGATPAKQCPHYRNYPGLMQRLKIKHADWCTRGGLAFEEAELAKLLPACRETG